MSSHWNSDLAVLDIGEIVEDGTDVIVATFVPTDESIAAWEQRVEVLNTEARAWRQLRAVEKAKLMAECCGAILTEAGSAEDGEWWTCSACGKRHFLDYETF